MIASKTKINVLSFYFFTLHIFVKMLILAIKTKSVAILNCIFNRKKLSFFLGKTLAVAFSNKSEFETNKEKK